MYLATTIARTDMMFLLKSVILSTLIVRLVLNILLFDNLSAVLYLHPSTTERLLSNVSALDTGVLIAVSVLDMPLLNSERLNIVLTWVYHFRK